MKRLKILLVIIGVLVSQNSFTQNSDLYVVTYRADWCPVTTTHEQRLNKEIKSHFNDRKNIKFITHDITNPNTSKKTTKKLQKLGLTDALSNSIYTGVSYILDAKNKELLHKISIAEQNYKIKDAINKCSLGKIVPQIVSKDSRVWYVAIQYVTENGQKKLNEFNKLAYPFFEKYGFKTEGAMKPTQIYVSSGNNQKLQVPDNVIILSAPNEATLAKLSSDPEYQKIAGLRNEALNDFIFIETKKLF